MNSEKLTQDHHHRQPKVDDFRICTHEQEIRTTFYVRLISSLNQLVLFYFEESIPCSARRSINLISNSITIFSFVAWILFFFLSFFFSMSFSSLERTFRFVRRGVYRERKRDWKLVNNFFFLEVKLKLTERVWAWKSCNSGIIDVMVCRSDESIIVFVLWAKDKWQISKCLVSCEQLTSSPGTDPGGGPRPPRPKKNKKI